MNIRISAGQLRFRITRDELAELLRGTALELNSLQHYQIKTGKFDSPLLLREEGGQITLLVNQNTLAEFEKQLPSREGIEYGSTLTNGKAVTLVLEVDVRKPRNN